MSKEKKAELSYLSFVFCFSVLVVAIKRRRSSLQSVIMLSYSDWVKRLVSFNKSSQYSVSAHSFRDIVALARNSFLLMEYWASLRFAPIDVPERNICFASVNSFLSSQRCLYRLYTFIANFRLFSSATFSIANSNIRKSLGISNKQWGKYEN